MKRNVAILGFVIGMILPLVGLFIVYLIKFNASTFSNFLHTLTHNFKAAGSILSLSMLINLLPFTYYISKRLDNTAKGILVATVLYGVLMVLLKYVW